MEITPEMIAQFRALIGGAVADKLTDDQVTRYIETAEAGNVKLAAADALDALSVSLLVTSRDLRTQDLQTSGSTTAKALSDLAARLRARGQAEVDAGAGAGDDHAFLIADTLAATGRGARAELLEPPVHLWGL